MEATGQKLPTVELKTGNAICIYPYTGSSTAKRKPDYSFIIYEGQNKIAYGLLFRNESKFGEYHSGYINAEGNRESSKITLSNWNVKSTAIHPAKVKIGDVLTTVDILQKQKDSNIYWYGKVL